MKAIYLLALIAASIVIPTISAQEVSPCGQPEELNNLKEKLPHLYQDYLAKDQMLEQHTKEFVQEKSASRGQVYIIPVVFHIIHNYGPENISDEQVYDALKVINKDFRKLNADTSSTVAAFKAIAADAEIEFRLAQLDPNGNCTNGIVRIASLETYKGNNGAWQGSPLSNLSRWPREKYLNVWVVAKIESGAAGYSNYPAVFDGLPFNDGIVMLHNYVGSIGTSTPRNSRTFTHESGHWLNLRHTWGNSNNPGVASNCNNSDPENDDGVADTPNTMGWTSCNLGGTSCGTLDNVQNYMEYSYCNTMFTQGQANRMRAALTSSTAQRNNLWTSANLAATGVLNQGLLCKADFSSEKTDICAGQSINFQDNSYNAPEQWNWTFTGGSPSSSPQQNPTVTYLTPGIYNVGLTVNNQAGTRTTTKNNYVTVLDPNGKPGPLVESFESYNSSSPDWIIRNPDAGPTWALANIGATGSKSMMINNLSNPAQRDDELISNTLDVSAFESLGISFKVAYAQKSSSSNDMLRVFITTNCGETWALRWTKSGADLASVSSFKTSTFTPGPEDWDEYVISNLPASYLKKNFRVKFVFTSGSGNNIYIDDINVFDRSALGIENEVSNLQELNVFPNPFNNETNIDFYLIQPSEVKITITDMLGKESVLLPQGYNLPAGSHKFRVNKSEIDLVPGIYFLKINSGSKPVVKKIMVQ